jgi:antitoxin FitA
MLTAVLLDHHGTLTVRNVDAHLKERLRVRAAQHGRSMEAELRQILNDVLAREPVREPNLAEVIRRRFQPLGGVELPPHPPVPVGEPPGFA